MRSFYNAIVIVSFIVLVSSQSSTICDEALINTFLPDVRDCNAWFFCGLQGPIRGKCVDQFVFNPKTRQCDWPHNVDCFQCPSNSGLHNIQISGSCRSFIRCISGRPSHHVCEYGLQFNLMTGQCDLSDVVQCKSGFRCPVELPNDGTIIAMRDNYNCSVYHACIGESEAARQQCNPELHFDPITNLCTFPNLTSCPINQHSGGPGSGPGKPGNPDPEYESTVQTTEISTQMPTEPATELPTEQPTEQPTEPLTELPTESPTNEPGQVFECPFDGVHPHPNECSEYFVCAGMVPHHMRCADGLYFNVAILQCDFPENADCDFYNTIN